MKLFYNSKTCSKIPFLIIKELSLDVDIVEVDIQKGITENGLLFEEINPKGYVPALELDNGIILTETVAICVYLASLKPSSGMMPLEKSVDYAVALEWLVYLSTELHQKVFYPRFSGFFGIDVGENWLNFTEKSLLKSFTIINNHLSKAKYLVGDQLTCPDMYLYIIITWAKGFNINISEFIYIDRFFKEISNRESVRILQHNQL